jgi:hypothetical protein
LLGFNAATFIDTLDRSVSVIAKSLTPGQISVSSNYAIRPAALEGLLREQGGMDASKNDERASLLCKTPDLITPQRIPGVYSNADDIAGMNRVQLKRFERLVT